MLQDQTAETLHPFKTSANIRTVNSAPKPMATPRRRVSLQPLASFGPPGTKGQVDQPWGHSWGFGVTPLQQDNPTAIAPAGRVHCSLDDLARFVQIHLEGERTGGLLNPNVDFKPLICANLR